MISHPSSMAAWAHRAWYRQSQEDHRGGAEIIVAMARIGPDGPTSGYFDRHGLVSW